jgi:membrane protein
MRFFLLAVAFIAATPLVSKMISDPVKEPRRGLQEPDPSTKRFSLGHIMEILLRAWRGQSAHGVSLLAAGVAFYALFAIFPGLGAATWIFGLLADPATIENQLHSLKDVLPAEAWGLIDNQLKALTSQSTGISIAGIVSLCVALYSARLAASSMMQALDVVYGIEETRGFLATNAIALLFTLMGIGILLIAIGVLVGVPIFLGYLGLSSISAGLIRYARWPALAVLMALALAVTYRFGPNRKSACWKWVTWGSASATLLWLIASAGFSWYVAAFNSYDKVYGSIGAAVILLFWFWITAYAGLLGAELDNAIERHAAATPAAPKSGAAG